MERTLSDDFESLLYGGDRESLVKCLARDRSLANKNYGYDNLPAFLWVSQRDYRHRIVLAEELLNHGADINVRDPRDGNTLLHLIVYDMGYPPEARHLQHQLVQLLFDRGSDLSAENNRHDTPFEKCQHYTATGLIPLFLLHLARFPLLTLYGISNKIPREFLSAFARGDRAKVREFLENDKRYANVRFCSTPILTFAFRLHYEGIFEDLLSYGANPNARNEHNATLLYRFLYNEMFLDYAGKVPMIEMLLNHGATIENQDTEHDYNPLHRTVDFNEPALVQLFLDRQVDVNALDRYDETPLYFASKDLEMTRLLLSHGANVNVGHGREMNPLHAATTWEIVQLLLEHGADVDSTDNKNRTLLQWAVKERDVPLVQLLLRHHADVNVTNNYGDTPLHQAAAHSVSTILQLLLDHEPEIDSENRDGETPLHVACFYCRVEAIKLLLFHQADVHATNKYGSTSLHNAVASEATCSAKLESVVLLLEHGADMNMKNMGSMTSLSFACTEGELDIIYTMMRLSPHHSRPSHNLWNDDSEINVKDFFSFAECRNTEKQRVRRYKIPMWRNVFALNPI